MARRPLLAFLVWAVCGLAAAAPAQKDSYDEYTQAITQAIRLGDEKRLDKAVRDNPVHTVSHYRGLVLSMLRDPNVENVDDRRALEQSWERVYEGRTLDFMNRWLQTLDQSALRQYDNAQKALAQAYAELARLEREKIGDRGPYLALIESLRKIAQLFEQIGDPLDASDAWGMVTRVYTVIPDRTLEDRKEGVFAMERFMEHRKSWQWTKDSYYLQNQNWLKAEKESLEEADAAVEKRKAEGYAGETRGVDAYLVPDADEKEIVGDLEFELLTKLKTDMCMQGGPIPMQWAAVTVQEAGPARFPWFTGADIFLVRPGANDYGITLDGTEPDPKKNHFVEIEVASKVRDPSEFELDAAGNVPYAMWFFVGGSQETYQGINQNLAPTREAAVVYYKSASSWVTDVDGTEVTFYDDNSNGKLFEEDPYAYGLKDRNIGAGPDQEVAVPAYDSMKIGRGPVQPYSQWVKIEDTWYHVRGKDDGTKVGFRPTNPEYFKTGSIQLDWSGGRSTEPAVLIVQGYGDFANARFDVSSGKPVEVPVGEYEVTYGRIESGKGARMMTANIFPGELERITVKEGETTDLELGAPFRLDFAKKGGDMEVEIDALTIRVRGRGGEVYTHINGAAPAPEVLVARSEDGKGAREQGEFVPIRDPETMNAVSQRHTELGSHVGFYPIPKGSTGETVLKVHVPTGHFVGLQEKKNKLFGKLEPIFK